jgi:hypothetical protein
MIALDDRGFLAAFAAFEPEAQRLFAVGEVHFRFSCFLLGLKVRDSVEKTKPPKWVVLFFRHEAMVYEGLKVRRFEGSKVRGFEGSRV